MLYLSFPPQPYLLFFFVKPALEVTGLALPIIISILKFILF
nr:MAG TPA: hypothetical protein [Bacteriophage sp.]